jgi:retron-type reverse transcriptase
MVIVCTHSRSIDRSRRLYFARVDIKSCFDTINQDKLLNLMQLIIKSDEYVLHRYCEVNMDQGKIRKRFNVRASAMGKASSFQDIICRRPC